MLGQDKINGTVGIKLSEASKSGLLGDDVSVDSASKTAERVVYVQSFVEGGAAMKSKRSPSHFTLTPRPDLHVRLN
jgi:hypothetical protein